MSARAGSKILQNLRIELPSVLVNSPANYSVGLRPKAENLSGSRSGNGIMNGLDDRRHSRGTRLVLLSC